MEKQIEPFQLPAEMLKVLGHPVRMCILQGIIDNEGCNVSFMQNCVGLPQSTVSMHLQKLRAAGLITGERVGLEVHYALKDPKVKEIFQVFFAQPKQ